MEWLTQNWILAVFAAGAVLLILRGGMRCRHADWGDHGRARRRTSDAAIAEALASARQFWRRRG